MIEPKILKGFRDFGPEDEIARQTMFTQVRGVFESYGFLPMATPALEYKEILTGKYGEDEKLIYSFKDNGERDVALRYDLTVPFARFIAMNQKQMTFPFKRYQIAPVWRADKPQKGRFREFYQCDVDVVLGASPVSDAEVMACICKALEAVGVKNYELRLNDRSVFDLLLSIYQEQGSPEAEAQELMRAVDKFSKIGADGVLKILEDKQITDAGKKFAQMLMDLGQNQQAIERIEANISADSLPIKNVKELLRLLDLQGVPKEKVVFDPLIVRGLDYYTGFVFEVVLKDNPDFGSIAGGGRYDNLVDQFSKDSLPAVGGSIGIDRLYDAMKEAGQLSHPALVKAIVLYLEENMLEDYVSLASELRAGGVNTEMYYFPTKLDKQFKYAENRNIEYAVIMGETEKQSGVVKVKNLKERKEQEIKKGDLVKFFKSA